MPYEDDARAQIARQTLLRAKTPLCAMNFAPFEAQLATLSEARKSWLDGVLRSESVAGLLRLLASESLTSVELVLACVQRIKQFSWLRAVVALNPHALELARSADKARVAPLRGSPLRGIPVLLKDNIGTGDGMPNTAGAAALQNVACDRDAFLVQRIRAAGGIPIGKTNLSEWANFFADSERGKPPNGFSAMGGQTRNPYGGFDVGGSSSGSASAVAAALVPVAVGTETHGSIIFPALRNSVCGLKPSLGLVSRDRIIPITDATDTAGPIARSMTDLCMLMDALTGFDARDPACVLTSLSAPLAHQQTFAACLRADGLAGVRVGVLHGSDGRAGSDTLLHAARGALLRAGASLVPVADPLKWNGVEFGDIMNHGFKHGVAAYLQAVNAPLKTIEEVIAFNELDVEARAPNGMGRMRKASGNTWLAGEYASRVAQARTHARAVVREVMQEHHADILVSFSQSGVGPHFVLAGAPLLSVPAGYLPTGEPYGITFAGAPFDDCKLLAAGFAFERMMPPRREPALRDI